MFCNLRALHLLPKSCPMRVRFKAGAMIFESYGLNYMGAPVLVHAQSILAVLAYRVVLMGAIEASRVNGPFGGRGLDLVYPTGK